MVSRMDMENESRIGRRTEINQQSQDQTPEWRKLGFNSFDDYHRLKLMEIDQLRQRLTETLNRS